MDAGAHFADPNDMIAAVSCLDFIVGTDDLTMHVAGALHVPGLAVAAAGYPWYFATQELRSIWYPSLEVARQASPGRWEDVLTRISGTLGKLAGAARQQAIAP